MADLNQKNIYDNAVISQGYLNLNLEEEPNVYDLAPKVGSVKEFNNPETLQTGNIYDVAPKVNEVGNQDNISRINRPVLVSEVDPDRPGKWVADGYSSYFLYDDQEAIENITSYTGEGVEDRSYELILEIEKLSKSGTIYEEQVLNNPTLITGIRDIMKARYSPETRNKYLYDEKYDNKMNDKDLFEEWQNWMRSLEGAQTVTTANDVVWYAQADENQRTLLGASFELFDAGPSILTDKNVEWSETRDGVRDYLKAGVWDPSTLAGLAVGRTLSFLGGKSAGMTFRKTALATYKNAIARGLTKYQAKQLQRNILLSGFRNAGIKNATRYSAMAGTDMAIAVGADYYNQILRIDTGVKEEYSVPQSVGAAMGVIMLPSLVLASKQVGSLTNTDFVKKFLPNFAKYKDISLTLGGKSKTQIQDIIMGEVDLSKVNSSLIKVFEKFKSDLELKNFLPYAQKASDAVKVVTKKDIAGSPLEKEVFFEQVLVGEFVQALKNAGFMYAPREANDNVSSWITDALKYLEPETILTYKKSFKSQFGTLPEAVEKINTAEELSSWFLNRGRNAGQTFQNRSVYAKLLGKKVDDVTVEDFLNGVPIREEAPVKGPQRVAYMQSIWKRAVTSHPSTLGLNVKGWGWTHSMNAMSDLVQGALLTTKGVVTLDKANLRAGSGSFLGGIRKGLNLMTPGATIESAQGYFKLFPEVADELFKERAGGIDNLKILERLGLDPKSKLNQVSEASINTLQKIMGVKLQDETTKMISFMGAIDQNIMMQYGMTYNKFMSQPNAYAKMFSPEYLEFVLEPAIERTKKETYSFSWSGNKNNTFMGMLADKVEGISNAPGLGFLLPFGRFFNTATETVANFSTLGALYHVAGTTATRGPVAGLKASVSEEGLDKLSKGLIGIGLIYGSRPDGSSQFEDAKEKIRLGIVWNKKPRNDGSIADVTFEFPSGIIELSAQILAHQSLDGEVPPQLFEELGKMLVSNTFRDGGRFYDNTKDFVTTLTEMNTDKSLQASFDILSAGLGKIVSGATRPAEPINQVVQIATGNFDQYDIKQGTSTEKLINMSRKYVDAIFPPVGEIKLAQSTTSSGPKFVDPGRTLGGVRSSSNPTPSERLLGSISQQAFFAISWGGTDEYKYRLNELVSDILNYNSVKAMEKFKLDGKNFFTQPLSVRQETVKRVMDSTKRTATEVLNSSSSVTDQTLVLENKVLRKPKKDINRALKLLIESGSMESDETIEDIKNKVGGTEKLKYLLFILDNMDSTVFRDVLED